MQTCNKHFYCLIVYETELQECPVCEMEENYKSQISNLRNEPVNGWNKKSGLAYLQWLSIVTVIGNILAFSLIYYFKH
jgi:hypothetical protein